MSLFSALSISGSGMQTSQTWLNALSGNIANQNDTVSTNQPVYQAQYVVAAPLAGGGPGGVGKGVGVAGVALGPSTGQLVYDPSNPLANAQGYVRQAKVNLGEQMVQLVMAQNGFQADASAFAQAHAAYQSALNLASAA